MQKMLSNRINADLTRLISVNFLIEVTERLKWINPVIYRGAPQSEAWGQAGGKNAAFRLETGRYGRFLRRDPRRLARDLQCCASSSCLSRRTLKPGLCRPSDVTRRDGGQQSLEAAAGQSLKDALKAAASRRSSAFAAVRFLRHLPRPCRRRLAGPLAGDARRRRRVARVFRLAGARQPARLPDSVHRSSGRHCGNGRAGGLRLSTCPPG